jgi:hypothetical protein
MIELIEFNGDSSVVWHVRDRRWHAQGQESRDRGRMGAEQASGFGRPLVASGECEDDPGLVPRVQLGPALADASVPASGFQTGPGALPEHGVLRIIGEGSNHLHGYFCPTLQKGKIRDLILIGCGFRRGTATWRRSRLHELNTPIGGF